MENLDSLIELMLPHMQRIESRHRVLPDDLLQMHIQGRLLPDYEGFLAPFPFLAVLGKRHVEIPDHTG
jgi:hypothetical protein